VQQIGGVCVKDGTCYVCAVCRAAKQPGTKRGTRPQIAHVRLHLDPFLLPSPQPSDNPPTHYPPTHLHPPACLNASSPFNTAPPSRSVANRGGVRLLAMMAPIALSATIAVSEASRVNAKEGGVTSPEVPQNALIRPGSRTGTHVSSSSHRAKKPTNLMIRLDALHTPHTLALDIASHPKLTHPTPSHLT